VQSFFTNLNGWWVVIALTLVALLWQWGEIVHTSHKAFSKFRARTEPIKLQYTAIYARVTHLKATDELSVELVVHLDNPTEFPIKVTPSRMLTTILYQNTDLIPPEVQTLVVAPYTQKVRVQSGPIILPAKKGRDRFTGYVEWQLKLGRFDVEPFKYTDTFNLRGDFSAHLINGGWETRWMPFDDSELIVEDEAVLRMIDNEGNFSRKRQV
jgi:hypothetical protein